MAYLTYQEYTSFGGSLDEAEFDKLLPKTADAINNLTLDFYADPLVLEADILTPQYGRRAVRFKKAITYQIEYYSFLGTTSVAQMNATPSSQSIGGTSVSYGDQVRDASGNVSRYAAEVIEVLEPTGLLYRGVGLCRRYR